MHRTLRRLKGWIRSSLFGPLIVGIYRLRLPTAMRSAAVKNDQYDRETVLVMERTLRADSSCVDVGAHEGQVLRHMMRLAPFGIHYAFEPLPYLADYLRSVFPKARVYQCACGQQASRANFVCIEKTPGYSGLRMPLFRGGDLRSKEIEVDVVRLDDVLPQDTDVAIIKLDIEGGELHALLGAQRIIHRCHPIIIFEAGKEASAQYGVKGENFCDYFEANGYFISTMSSWLAGNQPLKKDEFLAHWDTGDEFYFLAAPSRLI